MAEMDSGFQELFHAYSCQGIDSFDTADAVRCCPVLGYKKHAIRTDREIFLALKRDFSRFTRRGIPGSHPQIPGYEPPNENVKYPSVTIFPRLKCFSYDYVY